MSEIKMLPLPTRLAASGLKSDIVNFAERLVEHNVASRDAEIEALKSDLGDYMDAANYQAARAERLAEALRKAEEYIDDVTPTWASGGQGVLAVIRAALRDRDQETKK